MTEHVHDDACFDAPPPSDDGYTCGMIEHTHNSLCYFPDGSLRCTVPEHTHTVSCHRVALKAMATNDSVLVVAGSDFQDPATSYTSSDYAKNGDYTNQTSRITALLTNVRNKYGNAYGFLAGGDYNFDEIKSSTTKTKKGVDAVKAAVTGVFCSSVNSVFVQGNHDALWYLNGDKLEPYDATFANGYATFTTTHFSTWVVGENARTDFVFPSVPSGTAWVKCTAAGDFNTTDTYMIVREDAGFALGYLGNGSYGAAVTVTDRGNGYYNIAPNGQTAAARLQWTFSNINNGSYRLRNVNSTNSYLRLNNNAIIGTKATDNTITKVNGQDSWQIKRTAQGSTYYLRYNNSNFLRGTSDNQSYMTIYKQVTLTAPSTAIPMPYRQ